MAMEMRQQLKMSQQLVMTPQLQQAIKLLQLTRLELQDLVVQELEENPLLEESTDMEEIRELDTLEVAELELEPQQDDADFREVAAGEETLRDWDSYLDGYNYSSGEQQYGGEDERPSFENLLTKKGTLIDHLLWQLHMGQYSEMDVRVGEVIIGNVDDYGYLRASLQEIAAASSATEEDVQDVLDCIQEFDPPGVAARDLRECLLIQARNLGMKGSVVENILLNHLGDLEKRNYKQIVRALKIDINQVLMASKIISGFDPRPGSSFSTDDVHYISPDIFVHKVGDDYIVMLNEEGLPNLKVSTQYADARGNGAIDSQAENYINDKARAAAWLIKSIQQRQRTIYKVAKSIIRFQREYFDRGIEYLRPLVLRDIAEDIGMHESTISRVTTNKYMQTPQGLLELKYFFNSGLSTSEGDFVASESVKNRIKEIIEKENPKKPYSDQKITELLGGQTVNIARRTVTKYREMLNMGSSSERKKFF
ncbi:MAG TPA: RNA polymerase factor sigma-54 [Desulfuromonadales bacterium]|nr:RNA polymerase factor sigma-54 [Desulfuromonadales bacterium]